MRKTLRRDIEWHLWTHTSFALSSLKKRNKKYCINRPSSISSFSKNSLTIVPHHLGNPLIPNTFCSNSMMCQRDFQHQKCSSSTGLTVICQPESKTTPALSFSITAGRAVFPMNLTPSIPLFTGHVIALLWQHRYSALWPPRALITQHCSDCSRPKTLRSQRKTTSDSGYSQPLKSWVCKQQHSHGGGSVHQWAEVSAGLKHSCSKACFL